MRAGRAVGLLLGVVADAVVPDPRRGHPVAAFGSLAARAERVLYQDRRNAGVAYAAVLVGGAAGLGAVVQRCSRKPVWQVATTAAATWVVLGGASLVDEGTAMARSLEAGDVTAARGRLGNLCGRDPSGMGESELARATVESLAENTSDAVVAPLVWGALAGVPGLLGYRAANTLDAMVGRLSPRYARFGWASARLDDLLNLAPARLSAALAAVSAPLVGGSSARAVRTWRSDAGAHPSPNAGQVEAAFAGALGVQLGGRTVYPHAVEERPALGAGRAVEVRDVGRTAVLSRVVGGLAAGLAAGIALAAVRR